MKQKTFSERLIALRQKFAVTQTEMAHVFGLQVRMYQRYESGESVPQGITEKKYFKFLDELERRNSLSKYLPASVIAEVDERKSASQKSIPYFELDVSAGNIDMFSDSPELPSLSISIPGFDDCDMALPIYGDSMYPTFSSGMIVMCKRVRDKSIIQYGESYLVITEEQRMVKRLQKGDRRDSILAVSDNESVNGEGIRKYESFEIPRDKILHLYIVKGSIRRSQI